MKIIETPIPGLFVVETNVLSDSRGYFFEAWQEERYKLDRKSVV